MPLQSVGSDAASVAYDAAGVIGVGALPFAAGAARWHQLESARRRRRRGRQIAAERSSRLHLSAVDTPL